MAKAKTTPEAPVAEPASEARKPRSSGHVNQVTLTGRLTADPELRYSPNGLAICRMRVACNANKTAQFFSVVAFGEDAEAVAEAFKKAQQVTVQGRLSNSSFEKDGVRRDRTEIIASSVKELA